MAIASSSTTAAPSDSYATHEVLNQPGILADYNAFTTDRPLTEAVRALGGDWAWEKLRRAGAIVGSDEGQQLARSANRHLPELQTHDRFGHRVDRVEFHPAYHELMRLIFSTETHSLAWTEQGRPGAYVARAALSYLESRRERRLLPHGHDLCVACDAPPQPGHARRVAGEDSLAYLRSEADLRR
jgi:putative acyl-CoA dehydrogenase